ncbi:MAG: glycosyltransferase family 4 protein [Fibrobacteres bacterium]|nr:glycosyltransferase family 4 protein [Fibrobacterota bacterium]
MKVLFLHRDLPPDSYTGVAVQVHRLANALSDLGHAVSVYTHSALPADARYAVLPIRLPGLRRALRWAPFLKRLWYPLWYRRLPTDGFDVVHVHGDGGFLRYRGNFVRTFYGTAALEYRHAAGLKGKLAQGLSYWMERREARRCRLTVGISPHVAAHLPGIDRVIPCMLPAPPDSAAAGKTAFPSLVYLGSRKSRKRGGLALEIWRGLREKMPGLRLTYVGPRAEVDDLKGRDEYHGIDFRARISQAELLDLYRESWLYLCLSSYEGFGVGIIEAMACSCLVVTTPHPGSEFLVKDGETGVIAPPEKAASLIAGLLENEGARREIAKRAREFARRFAPAVVASAYLDLYRLAKARAQKNPAVPKAAAAHGGRA